MNAVPATEARRDFFELVRRALKGREPVRIQHREGAVLLISEEEYEGLLETLELLSRPGMAASLAEAEADIEAGRTSSAEQLLADV